VEAEEEVVLFQRLEVRAFQEVEAVPLPCQGEEVELLLLQPQVLQAEVVDLQEGEEPPGLVLVDSLSGPETEPPELAVGPERRLQEGVNSISIQRLRWLSPVRQVLRQLHAFLFLQLGRICRGLFGIAYELRN